MDNLFNFTKEKNELLSKLDKQKEITDKILNKKDFVEEHKPILENISSHSLYFEDEFLEGLMQNKLA